MACDPRVYSWSTVLPDHTGFHAGAALELVASRAWLYPLGDVHTFVERNTDRFERWRFRGDWSFRLKSTVVEASLHAHFRARDIWFGTWFVRGGLGVFDVGGNVWIA